MTNTEGTLALRKEEEVYTGPDAGDIALEAQEIRAIMELIYFNWDNVTDPEEAKRELCYELSGLKTLIKAHAAHAEQLYEAQ